MYKGSTAVADRSRSALSVVAALCLSGCATFNHITDVQLPVGQQAPDYVPVQVVTYPTVAEVNEHCATVVRVATGGKPPMLACALYTDKRCLIMIAAETSFGVLGHELMHCLWIPRTRTGNTAGVPVHFYSVFTPGIKNAD
jgi:hypothetical protein